jgi:anti-anti-sigma factor
VNLETSVVGREFVARIAGRLAFSDNAAFRGLFDLMASSGAKTLVLDLSDLDSIDSSGLGMFIIARDTAIKSNWDFRIRKPRGQVRQMLALARFESLMAVET